MEDEEIAEAYKLTVDGDGYTDTTGCYWDTILEYILIKQLGFCGCGSPESCGEYIRTELQRLRDGDVDHDSRPELDFLWYVLSDKGFLEHGTVIPGWLTEEGKLLLESLTTLLNKL